MPFQNNFYLVSYYHATSGLFIKIMLELLLYGEKIDKPIDFPLNGTAELNKIPYENPSSYSENFYVHHTYYMSPLSKNYYDHLVPFNSNSTFTYWEHCKPNWKRLFNRFPNTKNIIIQIGENTLLRQVANSYYKQKYKSIENLNDINHTEAENEVRRRFNLRTNYNTQTTNYLNKAIGVPYTDTFTIPEELKHNVFTLQLYDIIHNKEKVIETLEIVTNKKAFNNLILSYDSYLKRQVDLMPWLNDR